MADKKEINGDFFGGEATENAELARVAIGDGKDGTVESLEGFYKYSVQEWDQENERPRFLHAIELAKPVGQNVAYLLWGNYTLDKNLPILPSGTKVRLKFAGFEKLDNGRRLKRIDIITPKGTKRVPNPFMKESAKESAVTDEDNTPF